LLPIKSYKKKKKLISEKINKAYELNTHNDQNKLPVWISKLHQMHHQSASVYSLQEFLQTQQSLDGVVKFPFPLLQAFKKHQTLNKLS